MTTTAQYIRLESLAHEWACGKLTNRQFKFALYYMGTGYTVDLRQPTIGASLMLTCRATGNTITIHC